MKRKVITGTVSAGARSPSAGVFRLSGEGLRAEAAKGVNMTAPRSDSAASVPSKQASARKVIQASTIGAFFTLALSICNQAPAAEYLVRPDGSGDFPTIREAVIAAADSGDVILLDIGAFRGPGNRRIDLLGKQITIISTTGDPKTCTIDCEGIDLAFYIVSGEGPGTMLYGITIENGSSLVTGGIEILRASPSIEHCIFRNNTCTNGIGGGAIRCGITAAIVTDCTFVGNTSAFGGGAVACGSGGIPTFLRCAFMDNKGLPEGIGSAGAIDCQQSSPTIEECLFVRNTTPDGAGAINCITSSPIIRNSTFYGNGAEQASVVFATLSSFPRLSNSILAFGSGGAAIACSFDGSVDLSCCDLYGNAGGDWVGCVADQYGIGGNFSADPLFCDPGTDFGLHADSPCAPENNPECGLIGVLPVACGPTSVSVGSWGAVKAGFLPLFERRR